jgi:DnaK suppressor protein
MEESRAKDLLRRERERVERQLANLQGDGEEESVSDPGDAATQLHDREVDAGIAESLQADLAAIGRAEERLAQGKYGISVESGEPIPDARLEAIPWAERTAEEDEHHQAHR